MSASRHQKVNEIIDSFFDTYWQINCSSATFNGIHKYDSELDHWGITERKEYQRKLRNWRREIETQLKADTLDPGERLDLEVLLCEIEKGIAEGENFDRFKNDPSLYPNAAIMALLILEIREFAPFEERLAALLGRLKDIPRFLTEAKDSLRQSEKIPREWLTMAQEANSAAQRYFTSIITGTAAKFPPLRHELMAAATLASKFVEEYEQFISNELLKRADSSFAAGSEFYEVLLQRHHLLPYRASDLKKMGQEYLERTLREMRETAADIEPRKSLREVIEDIKKDTPEEDELENYYRDVVRRTREFVVARGLVTLPPDESLEIMTTPPSERGTLPYAAYMQPAPFETNQKGYFWVTPLDKRLSREHQQTQLTGHSRAAIEVRALHEGYPGHHLQLCLANRLPSKVRRVFGTNVFVEGWALYCEELMKREGFYRDRRTDLMQLKDQLWRSCRVVIDVGIHTGEMTFDEAVKMLVETAMLEPTSAVAEVRRYTQNPTQPMSYLIGKIEIERLSADYRLKFPNKSLRQFHDELLSYGSVPIALARREMLGT